MPRRAHAAHLDPIVARAGYMMGAGPEREWSPDHAVAWEGLLEVARRLRREAESHIEDAHGVRISMLGIMGRLERAPEHTLRQTDLAAAMGLSLSRVSRAVDHLQGRGLVERRTCPGDARAVNVTLTREGATLTAAAQRTTFAFVQQAFAARLSDDEVRVVATVMERLLTPASSG